MTQRIINNAGAISFDRDLTVAQTISASRRLKFFRQGPIQSILEVRMNVITQDEYRQILAALSQDLAGPYTLTLPAVVVGTEVEDVTVNGADTGGSTVDLEKVGTSGTTVLPLGTRIKFDGHDRSYVVTETEQSNASGHFSVTLDQPHPSLTDGTVVEVGAGIEFSMYLIERPRASQGPTGLVAHDGPFIFAEVV